MPTVRNRVAYLVAVVSAALVITNMPADATPQVLPEADAAVTAQRGDPGSFLDQGRVVAVGPPRRYKVLPGKRIKIHVRHVGTISGGKHSVSKPGILRVRKYRGRVNGVSVAG